MDIAVASCRGNAKLRVTFMKHTPKIKLLQFSQKKELRTSISKNGYMFCIRQKKAI